MNLRDHIKSDPEILAGNPVIKNNQISVEMILEFLSDGWTRGMILDSYPRHSNNDLEAVYIYSGGRCGA